MKISLVMACFNSQDSIAASIETFLKQDWHDAELVVMDGGSTDRTCEIVRGFSSPNIRIFSEPDNGIYDALNKGIQKCEGEVIGILHSNDLFARHDVLSTVGTAFEDAKLDALYADVAFFDPKRPDKITRIYKSNRFRTSRLAWGWMPAHTTLYLRRNVFTKFGFYKTNYRIAGDFEFVVRLFHEGNINASYIPQTWVHMQSGGVSTAGLKSKYILNREVMQACRAHGIKTNYFKLLSKYPLKLLEMLPRFGETKRLARD